MTNCAVFHLIETTTTDHNANPYPNQENPLPLNHLLISGKQTLLPGLGRPSTTCRAATAAKEYFTREYVKSSQPWGGIWTPDIYDHGSLSLLIHGLCIQAIYDPLPCALPGQLIIDRNLTPQTSPRYTLVTSLVKSQSWQIIWWPNIDTYVWSSPQLLYDGEKLANPICSVFFRKPSHDVISIHFTENAPKM